MVPDLIGEEADAGAVGVLAVVALDFLFGAVIGQGVDDAARVDGDQRRSFGELGRGAERGRRGAVEVVNVDAVGSVGDKHRTGRRVAIGGADGEVLAETDLTNSRSGHSGLTDVGRRADLVIRAGGCGIDIEAEGAKEGAVAFVDVDAVVGVGAIDVAGVFVDGHPVGCGEGAVARWGAVATLRGGFYAFAGHCADFVTRAARLDPRAPGADEFVGVVIWVGGRSVLVASEALNAVVVAIGYVHIAGVGGADARVVDGNGRRVAEFAAFAARHFGAEEVDDLLGGGGRR
jgi:hypothetical protein